MSNHHQPAAALTDRQQASDPQGSQREIPGLDLLPLAGYPVISARSVSVRHVLAERLAGAKKTALLFANTNFVMKCRNLLPWLQDADVFLLNDGVGLDIAALLKHGRRYKANLNGTDFVPAFLKKLPTRHRLFLFGGQPGIAKKAALVIERDIGQQVVGCMDGYTPLAADALCRQINESGAEIVLVALGNPLQEAWIRAHMHALDAPLLIGVGALFDFLSGETRRAPAWVQAIRCEWIFRLSLEPRRLLRRYTVDIAAFLYLCLRRAPPLA